MVEGCTRADFEAYVSARYGALLGLAYLLTQDRVAGAVPVACVGAVSVTDFVVPDGWPRYAVAQVDVKLPENRGMKFEVAAYR